MVCHEYRVYTSNQDLNFAGCTSKNLKIEKQTLKDLCVRLGLQTHFIDGVLVPSIWSKQSGGSFRRYNREGEVYRVGKS
jgi:hypothetical protein